ncbi:MAG: type-F conjugative transfer system pilin assembly protein TrbC [Deltaproteobacteria bacterium]|nr:type-F conjugative transfer system pilin assembly protein TrbC [Deltaproteobacteria bacterium]MDE0355864.1 type-F conjugative transfer system pilin assembly protein TrbC [Deltaproteobacteria bacterium]
MNRKQTVATAASLIFVLGLTAWRGTGRAEETPQDAARHVVDRVLLNAEPDGGRDLEDWSRSVIRHAMERAGQNASGGSAPLPAEGHAGRLLASLSGRANGPEVIVFMSLSAPAESWRQWSREAARIGAPLLLRGLAPDGFRATVKRVGAYLDRESGAAIDPRLFRLFDITAVPAVAVVPGGVPPCESRACVSDAAPPHDRIAGNIGLEAALEAVAVEGGPGRATARRHLAALRGELP